MFFIHPGRPFAPALLRGITIAAIAPASAPITAAATRAKPLFPGGDVVPPERALLFVHGLDELDDGRFERGRVSIAKVGRPAERTRGSPDPKLSRDRDPL